MPRPGEVASIPAVNELPFAPALIGRASLIAEVCHRAKKGERIALDTEADSFHSYHHKLCLIQLSFAREQVLIDPLAAGREALAPLAELLEDRRIAKVMHGADYDLRVLDRDLGAQVRNLRDTQVAAQLLGEGQTGLAALVAKELGIQLDKRLQRADFGLRPLPAELCRYAASDTAYLESLADRLGERLTYLGREGWWGEECEALESVRWSEPVTDPLAFEKTKGASRLRGRGRDRLAALHGWREALAASQNVPPFRILSAEALVKLAEQPPADLAALTKVSGVGRSLARERGDEMMAILSTPPPAPAREPRKRVFDAERERRIAQLREARDGLAAQLGLAGGVLAPRTALEVVATKRPVDESGLVDCLARKWRASVLAPVLLPVVAGWPTEAAADHGAPPG